jgi:hypothetical protein
MVTESKSKESIKGRDDLNELQLHAVSNSDDDAGRAARGRSSGIGYVTRVD